MPNTSHAGPFPHAPRQDLLDPPIEMILTQIRFPPLAELYDNSGYIKFATAIRESYPKATPLNQIDLDRSSIRGQNLSVSPIWKFEDIHEQWAATLSPDYLALEVKHYQSFSDFKARISTLWRTLTSIYGIGNRTRLGLRYIDRFATDKQSKYLMPNNWISHVNPAVFGMLPIGAQFSQAAQIAHLFTISEQLSLTFRSSFRREHRDTGIYEEAILDLDCFDSSTTSATDVSERLDDLKEVTHNAFWWTFGDLLKKLEAADG